MHAHKRGPDKTSARLSARVRALLIATVITALSYTAIHAQVAPIPAPAASTSIADLPTSAATSAAGPARSASATTIPPKTPASRVGTLSLDAQVRWLSRA